MFCDFDDRGICRRCLIPQKSPGFLRNCCGVPGCHGDSADRPLYAAASSTVAESVAGSGPGTELSKILKRFGIEPTPTCHCRAKAQQMDAWGPDECAKPERIEEVVAVMREEARARGLFFSDWIGRLLLWLAIRNAKRAAAS